MKIDNAERIRNCESLLLKITYLNIFVENHKSKRNSFGNIICVISFCQGWLCHHIISCHMTSFDRPSCQDIGCFIEYITDGSFAGRFIKNLTWWDSDIMNSSFLMAGHGTKEFHPNSIQ